MRRATKTVLVHSEAAFTKAVRLCGFVFAALLALTYSTIASGEDNFAINFSGRLTQANGAPVEGPVDVQVSFYRDATAGSALIEPITKLGLNLSNGVFSLEIPLNGADLKTVFEDGTPSVYVEITAAGKTYPRQKYLYTPLALRIPINEKQLAYDDTTGKLGLKMDASTTEGSVLTVGSGGAISWKKIEAANLVAKDVNGAAPSANQVLVYKDGSWVAGAVPSLVATYASGTSSGYLASADWNAFNGKQNALGFTPVNKAGDSLSGPLNMGGQAVTGLASPTATSDAATKGYVDGLALHKDGSTQLTGAWNVGAQNIINTGDLIMAGSKVLGLSANTADPALSGEADKGKLWFNSSTNELKYWDGSAAKILGVAGADIQGLVAGSGIAVTGSSSSPTVALSGVGAAGTYYKVTTDSFGRVISGASLSSSDLPATTVTPGSYTRATVTVDQQGRLTAASSGAAIADADISASANIAQTKISGLTTDLSNINASLITKEPAITSGGAGQYWSGNKTWEALDTTAVPEGTNQYFTNARAIAALSGSAPINYSLVTGQISINQASGTTSGYLSSNDWISFNNKQSALGYTPVNKAGDTITGSLNFGSNDLLATGNIQLSAAKTLGLGVYSSDPTGLTAADKGKTWFNASDNQIKFWDGSAAVALGVAGSGLGSLNGQSGNTQTFATPGTAGTAPSWSSNANAHTLHIPLASTSSVTAGLISNADYSAFSNKVSSVAQGVGIAVTTGNGTATVSLTTTGAAGSYAKVTTDAYGRVTSGTTLTSADIPPLDASAISSGVLPVTKGGTGAATLATGNVILGNGTSALQSVAPGTSGNVLTSNGSTWQSAALPATNWAAPDAIGSTTPNTGAFTSLTASESRLSELAANGGNYVGFKAPDALSADKVWVLPANDGTAGQVLKTDGAGNLGWASDGGGSVTSVTGTAPISVATGTTTPVISMTQANASTNGYLSASDWTTFNGKQSAGNYVTSILGDVTSGGFSAGTVTTTLAAVAIPGTAPKVTFDAKGRVTAGATLDAADIPALDASKIGTGALPVARGGTGSSAAPSNGQLLIGNGAGYTLGTLTAGTGLAVSNSSGAITISATADPATKVSLAGGTMTGLLNLPSNGLAVGGSQFVAANGNIGIGTTVPGAKLQIETASIGYGEVRIKSTGTSSTIGYYSADGGWDAGVGGWNNPDKFVIGKYNPGGGAKLVIDGSGNVGIGTTSPAATLDINGQIKIQGGSPGAGKVLTSDANGLATWSTAAVGSITGVTAGTGLTGGGTTGSVTLNVDAGTTANKLVQLDASAKLPAVDGSALTNLNPGSLSSAVSVAKGGTGLTTGTSGGIPYFSAASTMASSAALASNGVVLGGGAGAAPTATAAGAANAVLRVPSGGGAPSFGAIDVSQSSAVTGTLNLGNGGTGTSLLVTGGTGQYLKQTASGAAVSVGTIAAADLPTMVGDSGSGGTKGAVPAPASGDSAAGKYLKADGTWGVPPGTPNWAAPGAIGSTTPNTGAFTALTTSGNVGIGTTSPQRLLDINGTMGNSNGDIVLSAASGHRLNISGSSNYAQLVPADNAIGNPIYYEVHNQGANQGSPNGLRMGISGSNFSGVAYLDTFNGGVANTTPLALKTQGTERMRIDTAGNVGIGTTVPSSKLQVYETSGSALIQVTTAGSGLAAGFLANATSGNTPYYDLRSNGTLVGNMWWDSAASYLGINGAGTKTVLNVNGGNVGIGTTAPYSQLHVAATLPNSGPEIKIENLSGTTASAGFRFKNTVRNWGLFVRGDANDILALQDDTASAIRMAIDANGNVGIGTIAPAAALQVTGQIATTLPSILTPTGTTQTINFATGNIQTLNLSSATGTVTLTFTNVVAGGSYALKIIQGATARTLTWPTGTKWPGGTPITLSTNSGAVDLVTLFYDGASFYAVGGNNFL